MAPNAKSAKLSPWRHFEAAKSARLQNAQNFQKPPQAAPAAKTSKTCGTQQDEPAAKTPKNTGSVVTVTQILEGVPTYSEPWTSKSEQTYPPTILQMNLRLARSVSAERSARSTRPELQAWIGIVWPWWGNQDDHSDRTWALHHGR